MDNRELLVELGYEDSIVFENPDYDSAIIGVTEDDDRVVYDFDLMVKHLVDTDGITELEAIEFIEYNTIRSLPYVANAPVIIRRIQ
jgi:hypothetical protein